MDNVNATILDEIDRLKAENAMLQEIKAIRAENARMKRNARQRSRQAEKRAAQLAGYAPLISPATMAALGYGQ